MLFLLLKVQDPESINDNNNNNVYATTIFSSQLGLLPRPICNLSFYSPRAETGGAHVPQPASTVAVTMRVLPACHIPKASVSVRVQKDDLDLHPDLILWTWLIGNGDYTETFGGLWTYFKRKAGCLGDEWKPCSNVNS